MTTCKKKFLELPFAHRQHNHDGHCALIHGHNWTFEFTFAADRLDANEFVVDFGRLKWLRAWLEERFDHTLLLNRDDPHLELLERMLTENLLNPGCCAFAKIVAVPNCGAEGLARWVLEQVNKEFEHLGQSTHPDYLERRVHVAAVTVYEDSRNSATYDTR